MKVQIVVGSPLSPRVLGEPAWVYAVCDTREKAERYLQGRARLRLAR